MKKKKKKETYNEALAITWAGWTRGESCGELPVCLGEEIPGDGLLDPIGDDPFEFEADLVKGDLVPPSKSAEGDLDIPCPPPPPNPICPICPICCI